MWFFLYKKTHQFVVEYRKKTTPWENKENEVWVKVFQMFRKIQVEDKGILGVNSNKMQKGRECN